MTATGADHFSVAATAVPAGASASSAAVAKPILKAPLDFLDIPAPLARRAHRDARAAKSYGTRAESRPVLSLQRRRQPEGGEQLRGHERRDLGDHATVEPQHIDRERPVVGGARRP